MTHLHEIIVKQSRFILVSHPQVEKAETLHKKGRCMNPWPCDTKFTSNSNKKF